MAFLGGGYYSNPTAVSFGGWTPSIFLTESGGGHLIIHLQGFGEMQFHIGAYDYLTDSLTKKWYKPWLVELDTAQFLSNTDSYGTISVPYYNEVVDISVKNSIDAVNASISTATIGTAAVNGNIIARSQIGIQTETPAPDAALDVNGNVYSRGRLIAGNSPLQRPSCFADNDIAVEVHGMSYFSSKISINEPCFEKAADYMLAVNGAAIFTKAKVSLRTTWPDYVFKNDYKLRSLKELDEYIKRNNHLPEIPSEAEIKKDGIDLGDNQALLLKKIEELTLYAIEQSKQQENLNKKLEEQQKVIEELKKLVKK